MSQKAKQLYDSFLVLSHHFNNACCTKEQCEDFSLIDYLALRSIQSQPQCSIQTIACTLGFTKSGATRVIKRLERRGLISIGIHSEDARIKCVALTDAGQECMASVSDFQSQRIEQLLKKMGPEASQQLLSGIQALMQHIK